jgi:hypothetical protein
MTKTTYQFILAYHSQDIKSKNVRIFSLPLQLLTVQKSKKLAILRESAYIIAGLLCSSCLPS